MLKLEMIWLVACTLLDGEVFMASKKVKRNPVPSGVGVNVASKYGDWRRAYDWRRS